MLVLEELQLLRLMVRYFGAEMPEPTLPTLTSTSIKDRKEQLQLF